jgi:gliding motility-associated-like protein
MFIRTQLLLLCLCALVSARAQNGFRFYCTKDTTVAACGQGCATLTAIIPDIHGQSDTYTINKISGGGQGCFAPYVDPNNNLGNSAELTLDDRFGPLVNLGFTFTFFGANYTQFVAGSNGEVSFDVTMAGQPSGYTLPDNLPSTFASYARAVIMGLRHDIDMQFANTSPNKRIQYQVIGTSPHRKWVLSYYKVPTYSSVCWPLFENTHQIVLYEGTGIVEVFVYDRQPCTSWNQGRGMIGMQDYSKTVGITVPGRGALDPVWGSVGMNEMWRFVPNTGISLLKRVELVNRSTNTIVATVLPSAVTNLNNGTLKVTFPTVCSPAGTTEYIVRPVYKQIDKQILPTAEIFGADTIRVTRPPGILNAAATSTAATCATGGTVTVTVSPAASYQYRIDGGAWQSSNTFNNVAVGPHTVDAAETGGSCTTSVSVSVNPTNPLDASATGGATLCPGTATGTATVTPVTGTAPFQYKMGSGAWQLTNSFTGLAAGTYTFYTKDVNGCTSNPVTATITEGPAVTASATATSTSCQGASDGSVQVTATAGTGPFEYSMNAAGPWQASNTFTNLAAASYNFYVKAAGGCVSPAAAATVNAGPQITATASPLPTSCQGATDGSVTVNAQSGTGPFEYRQGAAGTWQSANSFTALAAGSYDFYMRNASGCITAAIPVTISAGSALQAVATAASTSCSGANDGTVTVTNQNGTGPFEYRMSATGTWQASGVFSNLAPGTYDFYIRNAGGCVSAAVQATVTAGSVMQASAIPTSTSCQGATNGSVQVNALSGSGPFEYRMGAAGTWQSSNIFPGLASGSYTFYAKAASGCISNPVTANVSEGAAVTAQAVASATSCSGASDGYVTVTAPTGTGPFEYSMGTSGVWQSSGTFSGLAAASYTFYSRNGVCTSAPVSATVNAGAVLQASTSASATSCAGASDGTVTVASANGTGPFEYRLSANGTWQSSGTFTGLAAGSYDFYVRNASGCISPAKQAVVSAGAELQASASPTATSCAGASDGTVTVTSANGSGTFEYRMSATGTWQSSGTFTGLAAGSYDFYVRNASGCISPAKQAVVSAGSALQASATATATSCAGAVNGSVQVNALSGNAPFEYRMGSTGAWQSSNIFTGLAAGTYTFYTRTGSCMSNAVSATVNAGTALTATTTKTDVNCFGGSNGTATLTPAASGASPFTYSSDNFNTQQSNNSFTGLAANSYTFYYKDAAGCTGNVNVVITQPAQLASSTPVTVTTKCNGSSDGSITLAATGGTSPYQYSLSGGANQSSGSFIVPAGNYSVQITDSKGCTLPVDNIVVSQPTPLALTVVQAKDASCNGGADGQIQLTGNGGTSPYRFTTGSGLQTSAVFNVNPGSYNVGITDNNNCVYTQPSPVVIGLTNDMAYTPMADQTVCEGSAALLQTQTNANQFTWQGPGISTTIANPSAISATPAKDTFYTVVATFGRCSMTDTVNVYVNPAPVADAGAGNTICFGKSDTLSASGGVVYEWSPSTYLTGNTTGPDPVVFMPQKTITYTLFVKDAAGCRSLQPSTVTVNVTPPLLVQMNPPDTIGYFGDSIKIRALSIGTTYSWTPTIGLSNPDVANPSVYVMQDMVYKVLATTAAGCSGEGTFKIRAYKGPDIYVPTAFTPNGDGLNDRVRPFSVGIEHLNYFRVFDRWGQLMYEYKGEKRGPVVYNMLQSTIGWDGTFKGKGVNTGTFVWLAEGITAAGKTVFRKGSVTLIR